MLLSNIRWSLLTALVATVGLAGTASAVPVFPTLMTIEQVGAGTMTIDSDMALCSSANGESFSCDGTGQVLDPANPAFEWTLSDWNLSLDTDPFVNSAFGFTNNSAIAQTFVITVNIPVAVFGPASLIGGSMGGSTTDANNNGVGGLSTSAPFALFEGLVDGSVALQIYPDPQSFGFIFGGQTITIPAQNPGLPGPTLPGPALGATIGIRNTFTLSGGDSVAMTNFFEVVPVPEPGTGLLVGFGLLAIALRRSR